MIGWLRRRFSSGPSCDEVMEVLQTYLDGETDHETARWVAEHLDVCDGCGPEAEVYRRIKLSLHARSAPVDPEILAGLEQFGRSLIPGDSAGPTV